MTFEQAQVAIEILGKYTCGEELNGEPITGDFEFAHDQCWVSLPRTTDEPELTAEEKERMESAGWFIDDEGGGWSHF